jgi:D-alanyl-lipoteichoic acid acyltransferase DltB (MBOAT superfamily)
MLFNSFEFIFIFLPVSFFVYFYLNHKRLTIASRAWLVFSSLFFYGWWNIAYLPLILVSILFNYTITNTMAEYDENKKNYFSKRSLLQIALVFNIGFLGYFKYMDFFIENINLVFDSDIGLLYLALPLAISFFTLQQIAFVVDSYEGLVKEKSFLDYTVFVTFFPQLIAGPIVHHKEMMPQFANIRNKVKRYKNISLGLLIFSIGLFKKVVIADTFAIWASYGFDTATILNVFEAWATSLSYTFQLYFDFSGYTDMAIGAALLFNIKIPINFNSPYKALSIIDFWQRWHISLSNFIGTYVYTPIIRSFNKLNFHKAMFATILTFIIVGLWHGASWMFVIFGTLHGIALTINHYWKRTKFKINNVIAWFITFNFVNLTMVIFRAKEWDDVEKVLSGMLGMNGISSIKTLIEFGPIDKFSLMNIIMVFLIAFVGFFMGNSTSITYQAMQNKIKYIYISALLLISTLHLNRVSEFIYFNF